MHSPEESREFFKAFNKSMHLEAPILALGLGRIFDVPSSSESCSPIAYSPASYGDNAALFHELSGHHFEDINVKLTSKEVPKCIGEVVDIPSLSSHLAAESILAAEARKGSDQWLAVHVQDTTTILLFPPLGCVSLGRFGLTSCMEWLEDCGISQVLVVVPAVNEGEAICKSLLFLGFSRLPRDVAATQLPTWLGKYNILVTDFTEI
ncbi:unnamed protein product [Rodentolepis nana]|uniref:Ornithine decarboxylase antizyme n=1 Tax=Rodentolepis nana TaxID=102285 RepID=A0A0R3TM48_RODNA|nr:unnamed protein product [Rodentolepis nana]